MSDQSFVKLLMEKKHVVMVKVEILRRFVETPETRGERGKEREGEGEGEG